MKNISENNINKLFQLGALIFVVLAIVGGVRTYSPVPFWDMWNGYLGFYTKVSSGDWSAWWAQHNEHRIVLARIFFWIDLAFFSGQGWFLIVVNYLSQGIVCMLFWTIWKESRNEKQRWIGYFLIAWLFWWIQKDNLEWGFQSQFILAQLLPLVALYFLHRSVHDKTDFNNWFALALVFGVLSVGSMANGVLALPIMLMYAVLARMGERRILILGVASTLMLGIYFYDYISPAGHGSLGQALRTNPLGLLHYVVVYIGGAFSFGNSRSGLWIATMAGVFLVGSSVFFAFKFFNGQKKETLRLALIAFILYVGGTALGTAGGRLIFGVETALASRYMTPSLMAWAALLVLYLPQINSIKPSLQKNFWVYFLILLLLMLPRQLESLTSKEARNFDRKLAALAVELDVRDEAQIKHIFPSVDWIFSIAEKPIAENLSIFGMAPIKDKREMLGVKMNIETATDNCKAVIDKISKIDNDPKYLKISGWFSNQLKGKPPGYAVIVDNSGKAYGVLLIGDERKGIENVINSKVNYSIAEGYLLSNVKNNKLKLLVPEISCLVHVAIASVD